MSNTLPDTYATKMLQGYLSCAIWTTIENNSPISANTEIAVNEITEARKVCEAFITRNDLMLSTTEPWASDGGLAGHDLWLTRNGHGAGFWDRGAGEVGEHLTLDAHDLGTAEAYIGDDGYVYGVV